MMVMDGGPINREPGTTAKERARSVDARPGETRLGETRSGETRSGGTRSGETGARQESPSWFDRLPPLVLASQSPRRQRLLDEAGLPHHATHPGVDDGVLRAGSVSPEQWVKALAYLKAAGGARRTPELLPDLESALVIGADTVCVMGGRMFGQPKDEAEARSMLRGFEGAEHEVITGVALLPVRRGASETLERTIFVDRAVVRWGQVGEAAIDDYVRSGQWRGKAGAYNLSERLEAGWPISYDGDPTTIMGLPMNVLRERLERWAARRERAAPRGG